VAICLKIPFPLVHSRAYNRGMDEPKWAQLRFFGLQIICLVLLTSPIWHGTLVANFAVPVFGTVCAAVGASAILLTVRRLNHGDDRRRAKLPPDAP
jgi:hypothetical protein